MTVTPKEEVPYDLLSHFLTHSYFNLIEKMASSNSHTINQPIASFLFTCTHNTQHTHILQRQVFDHYIDSTSLSPTETLKHELKYNPSGAKIFYPIRNNLSFRNLRKVYSKRVLKLKLNQNKELLTAYNVAYIHLHQSLIYATVHDHHKQYLPITSLNQAQLFIDNLSNYYNQLSS